MGTVKDIRKLVHKAIWDVKTVKQAMRVGYRPVTGPLPVCLLCHLCLPDEDDQAKGFASRQAVSLRAGVGTLAD